MSIERTNELFARFTVRLLRHRMLVLLLFVGLLLLSALGVKRLTLNTSWDDYFLKDDPMLVQSREFKSIFGNDYYVGVLVRCQDVFTHENLTLIRQLSQELLDSLTYAERITSLTDLEFTVGTQEGMRIEQIVPETIPTAADSLAQIRARVLSKPHLARRLISNDGAMTWLMVKLRPFPPEAEWKQQGTMGPEMITGQQVARIIAEPRYRALSPLAAGMPYLAYEKHVYFSGEIGRLMLIGLIGAILVMALITRSLRGILSPLLTTACGLLIGIGTIGWTGIYFDITSMMTVLILTFACSIAYNVHLFNRFKTFFVEHGGRKEAIVEAARDTGWGIVLSALTTVAAMMTFLTMRIVPMQAVGIDTSICLLCVLGTCLCITPVLLSWGKDRAPHPLMHKSIEGFSGNLFARLGQYVLRHHWGILITSGVILLLVGIGLPRIEPAFDAERTLGRGVPYVDRTLTMSKSELGSIYSYDLLVVLPNPDDAKRPDNLRRLETVAQLAQSYPLTKRCNSILDVLKDMNFTLNGDDPKAYSIPQTPEMVAQQLLLYENAGGSEAEYWMDYEYRRLRLQVEMQDYNSYEAEREMKDLVERTQALFPGAQISTVGSLPQFTVMQQYVVRGQMGSMLLSVLVIGVILMLVFRSWRVAVVGMIPNIAPAIVVGGLMGWLHYPLDMMTASLIPMVLGLSVDDTIHIINHAHTAYHISHDYDLAIPRTLRVEGLAIVMSTVVIVTAFLGYLFSGAIQVRNWGVLATTGLLVALLADLFLTPILLKYFRLFK